MDAPADAQKPEKGTVREHLELGGALPEEPECPEEVEYLVRWAFHLHARSGSDFGVVLPLSYREIKAWSELLDLGLEPYEVEALERLDTVIRTSRKEPTTTAREADSAPSPIPNRAWPTKADFGNKETGGHRDGRTHD